MPTTDDPAPAGRSVTLDEAFAEAQALHRSGRIAPAHAIYLRILEAAPEHVSALHFAGVAAFQLGHAEDATALIEAALRLDPDYADAHNNLGNVLKRRGEIGRARAHYERALALRPNDPDALNNVGTLLRAEHRLVEALAAFDGVVALRPDHVEAHHNRGNVLIALGRDDEGLVEYQRALMLRPYDRNSYRQLGAAFYSTNRVDDAAEVYRRWLALMPDDAEAKHMLAACTGEGVPARASNEMVKLVFDTFAMSFDAVLARLEYRAPALVAETVLLVRGEASADATILDAGCGTGLGGPLLRPYAKRLVGVDISERMLEAARARGSYDELVVGDLTSYLEGHAATYDLVTSIDTLVYFGDLAPVVAGVVNALTDSGHFVFSIERAEPAEAPRGFRLNPHGRYSHTEGYVSELLKRSGLSAVTFREVVLRKEAGKPVPGYVVAAGRRAW